MIENQIPVVVKRPLPEPNPVTRRAYKRQSFWQITFPFLLALLIMLALAGGTIWAAVGGLVDVTRWADISVIWLLSPQLFFSLIPLVLLSGMVYLLAKLMGILPRYSRLMHEKILFIQKSGQTILDKLVEPVFKIRSLKASVDEFKRQISRLPKG